MSELPLSDQAIVRLADRVAARHPDDVALLERLVRIPSVSGPDPDSEALARSAQAVADELDAARLDWVRIVDGARGTPSVIGERRGPGGRICGAPVRPPRRPAGGGGVGLDDGTRPGRTRFNVVD